MNEWTLTLTAALAGFALTALLGFVIIPKLRKLKFGQKILEIGPKWHKSKEGTPTMGGIMFILGTVGAVAIAWLADILSGGIVFGSGNLAADTQLKSSILCGLLMAFSMGLVGFADDYVKVVKKRNKGLSIGQKTLAQLLICLAYLGSLYISAGGAPRMFIPFYGEAAMGWLFWPFGICVIYAAINAVNFTDGIDGLCSSVTVSVAVALGIIAAMRGLLGVSLAAAALAGACGGFLMWNRFPAKVFMGDTGSMFLGGMVVALAYALGSPLILLAVGAVYVLEGLSDVLQIGYFKLTHGKRIFKMAPIHHHFEMSGWSEKKIVVIFTCLSLIGCLAGIAAMYYGGYPT